METKLDASANQLILNCRIDEHSENNNSSRVHTYVEDNKTMQRFCLEVFVGSFWRRKHQKLHKRAAQPKTYDSRGRHLSDYNNSSNSSSSGGGFGAMKQSAQLNWGPRHSSRPKKKQEKNGKDAAKPEKNRNYFFAQRCGKLKTPAQLAQLLESAVLERVSASGESGTGSRRQEGERLRPPSSRQAAAR